MADITAAGAIKFCNEDIRPLCEQARAIKARIADATNIWFGGMNALFPNTADLVVDGRQATEGVSQLTGADVNSVMSELIGVSGAINDQIVAHPCVRPLQVTG